MAGTLLHWNGKRWSRTTTPRGSEWAYFEVWPFAPDDVNAAEQLEPTISEPLTWAEICERYPDEWVCVVDIDYDHPRVFDFRTARVVSHSKTKREAFERSPVYSCSTREPPLRP